MEFPINTQSLQQNWHYFVDDIFKLIFLNGNCCILIPIWFKSDSKSLINNEPVLVQIMAFCQSDKKP